MKIFFIPKRYPVRTLLTPVSRPTSCLFLITIYFFQELEAVLPTSGSMIKSKRDGKFVDKLSEKVLLACPSGEVPNNLGALNDIELARVSLKIEEE